MKQIILILMIMFFIGHIKSTFALEVLSFNVQNLFDWRHDPGKQDFAFLPKGHPDKNTGCLKISNWYYRNYCLKNDWTQEKFEAKLKNIIRVIESSDKRIDILALNEIENEFVAKRILDDLNFSGYVITKCCDKRGANTAVFYRNSAGLTFLSTKEVPLRNLKRSILEVKFKTKNSIFHLFAHHWPSGYAPTRIRSAIAESFSKYVSKKENVISIGDYNTSSKEEGKVFNSSFFKRSGLRKVSGVGTYFYKTKKKFEQLDRVFLGKRIEVFTLKVLKSREFQKRYIYKRKMVFIPRGTSLEEVGFSDHFPILLSISSI